MLHNLRRPRQCGGGQPRFASARAPTRSSRSAAACRTAGQRQGDVFLTVPRESALREVSRRPPPEKHRERPCDSRSLQRANFDLIGSRLATTASDRISKLREAAGLCLAPGQQLAQDRGLATALLSPRLESRDQDNVVAGLCAVVLRSGLAGQDIA